MKLWFYHHFRTAYGSPMNVTSGSPWLVPRGIRKIKALLLARLIRCADPIVWGSEVDLATTLQSRSGHGENRVPHGWKNPMAPMIWRTQLGGFISVYLIFWHTHTPTKGSQHPSLGPPPEDRWHQSRQWRWRWCWRPCHHPGSYNFLAIQCTFRSKKGPNGSPRSYPSVVFITSLTIVYMYLYIYIYVCVVTPKRWGKNTNIFINHFSTFLLHH